MSHCPSGWGASRSTMGGARWPLQVVDTGHARASRGGKHKASRGFEPRSLDSESRVLTVTPRGQMLRGHPEAPYISAALIPMQRRGYIEVNSDAETRE